MDHIKSQLDQLSELDDAAVAELQNSIISEFESVESESPTPQSVEAMTTLADMLDNVRGEVSRREVQAEELATLAAEASSRVRGEAKEETLEGDESEEEVVPAEEEEPEKEEEFAIQASAAEEEATELSTEETPTEETETELSTEDAEPKANAEVEAEADKASVENVDTVPVEAVEAPQTEDAAPAASEEAPAEDAAPAAEFAAEEAATEAPIEAEASTSEENTSAPEAQEEAPVTAAADGAFEAPADRRPAVQKATVAPVAITAGADIPGYTAGSTIDSMSEVSKAMEKRIHSLRRVNGGDGEQHIVASLTTTYPEDRILGQNSEENTAKIKSVAGPEAIMASGGFLAPLEASYDIFDIGASDARPVRDALPRFQADRGGIRFIKPPLLSSYTGAVGIWTEEDDIAAAGRYAATPTGPTKNLLIVGGAQEDTAMTYAVTLQLQFGNLLTRAYPELIARHNELALVQHARLAEITLLNQIDAKSTHVTTTSTIGFARDFLVQIKRAAAAYRSRYRLAGDLRLRAIVPEWVQDAMAADLTLNMPGDDNLGVTDADINRYLNASGVNLTASPDQNSFPAQAEGALNEFPDTFTWYLFTEGTFVFLDGGTLDIGLIRDSGLVGTNDYRMFTETFEGVAMVGVESLAITSTIAVNGTAAALATPVEY